MDEESENDLNDSMIGSTHQQGGEYSSNNAGDGPEEDDEA